MFLALDPFGLERPVRLDFSSSIVEDDRCFRVFKSSVQYNLLREFPSPRWRSCSWGFAISIIPFLVRIPVLFIHQRPYSRLPLPQFLTYAHRRLVSSDVGFMECWTACAH